MKFDRRDVKRLHDTVDLGRAYARTREYREEVPLPKYSLIEAGAFVLLKDGTLAVTEARTTLVDASRRIRTDRGVLAREQVACFLDQGDGSVHPKVVQLVNGLLASDEFWAAVAWHLAAAPPPRTRKFNAIQVIGALNEAIRKADAGEPVLELPDVAALRPRGEEIMRKDGWERHELSWYRLTAPAGSFRSTKEEREEDEAYAKRRLARLKARSDELAKAKRYGSRRSNAELLAEAYSAEADPLKVLRAAREPLWVHGAYARAAVFDQEAWLRYARSLAVTGQKAEALKALVRAQWADPEKRGPWDEGIVHLVGGKPAPRWVGAFVYSLPESPAVARARRSIGPSMGWTKKEVDLSIRLFEAMKGRNFSAESLVLSRDLVKVNPFNQYAWLHLARCLYKAGDKDQAVRVLEKAALALPLVRGPWTEALYKMGLRKPFKEFKDAALRDHETAPQEEVIVPRICHCAACMPVVSFPKREKVTFTPIPLDELRIRPGRPYAPGFLERLVLRRFLEELALELCEDIAA